MFKKLHILFLSLLLILVFQFGASAQTEHSVTNYSMYVDIQPDGSAYITETLIYDFRGEYDTISYRAAPAEGSAITDLNVYVDGAVISLADETPYADENYTFTEKDGFIEIVIVSPGKNDTRFVTYEYVMTDLADRYEDTGTILHRFISADSGVPLQNAIITIHFQEAGEEGLKNIHAFAHGGMDVEHVTLHDNVIELGPQTITSGNWVEVRLLFPSEYLSDMPMQRGNIRDLVLAEEERLDAQAAQRTFVLRVAKLIYSFAYALIFLSVWLGFVRRYGLKGRIRKQPDPYRVLNFPAAFTATVVNDEPDCNAASGTLLELIQLGYIRMEAGADKKELYFTLLDVPHENLYPHQEKLIEWLFEDRDSFILSELSASGYEAAQVFERGLAAYCEQVVADMNARHLKYRNDIACILVSTLIILLGVLGCGGILLTSQSDVLLGSGMICVMFGLIYLMNRIRRLTDEGELLQTDARTLVAREVPTGDDMYPFLSYYTALGMTEPLMHAVESRRLSNQVCRDPEYLFIGWHHALRSLSNAMRDAHQHNASMPRSNGEMTDPGDISDDI